MRFNQSIRDAVHSHLNHIGVNPEHYTPLSKGTTPDNLILMLEGLRLRADWSEAEQGYILGLGLPMSPVELIRHAYEKALNDLYGMTPSELAGLTGCTTRAIYNARSNRSWHIRNWNQTCRLNTGSNPHFEFDNEDGGTL